jgi:hypothetical protein
MAVRPVDLQVNVLAQGVGRLDKQRIRAEEPAVGGVDGPGVGTAIWREHSIPIYLWNSIAVQIESSSRKCSWKLPWIKQTIPIGIRITGISPRSPYLVLILQSIAVCISVTSIRGTLIQD